MLMCFQRQRGGGGIYESTNRKFFDSTKVQHSYTVCNTFQYCVYLTRISYTVRSTEDLRFRNKIFCAFKYLRFAHS
jgi:hypothetical protein